ncbi:hypothetical protein ONZ43_g4239 [Nemania bipapillata]|uniref:Uncharacterized protein n=1 Tax=Nemania bipapillata TaxID=110536 RepID=A0ACC2IQC4_9PEZI|nr:hypothetical protein ONZ43_g4239 [Nemania bipapillata]
MAWNPFHTLRLLSDTPTLLVTPEDDQISPAEAQKRVIYNVPAGPRHMQVVPGTGHMDLFDGDSFASIMLTQVDFIRRHMADSTTTAVG